MLPRATVHPTARAYTYRGPKHLDEEEVRFLDPCESREGRQDSSVLVVHLQFQAISHRLTPVQSHNYGRKHADGYQQP